MPPARPGTRRKTILGRFTLKCGPILTKGNTRKMAKSEAYANDILDQLFGSGSPATIYFGLYTTAPNADGTGGVEVATGSYARGSLTNNNTNFPAASGGDKSNATAITFPTATANWGSIVAVGVFTASSGGTPKYFGALTTPRTVNNGDTFSFSATQFVVEES